MSPNVALTLMKKQISDSFPTTYKLSHSDCVELRGSLVGLTDKDLYDLLGPILLDLLETHTDAEPDWSDSVVRFFCGNNSPPIDKVQNLLPCIDELEAYASSRGNKCVFDDFTHGQVLAIWQWLNAVKSWNASNIPTDELVAALDYWKKKRDDLKLENPEGAT